MFTVGKMFKRLCHNDFPFHIAAATDNNMNVPLGNLLSAYPYQQN